MSCRTGGVHTPFLLLRPALPMVGLEICTGAGRNAGPSTSLRSAQDDKICGDAFDPDHREGRGEASR